MGILDVFKKKEEKKAPLGPSPEETPITQALQMKERGLTNNQIIQVLQQQGYNPQQIYDALAQAEARQSIEPYTPEGEAPREELPPGAPIEAAPAAPVHATEEIVESVVEEKWQRISKEFAKMSEWKDSVNARMERIEQQILDLKSNLDGLHKAIIARVGEYDKTLSEVGTEIKAMEKVFKDVLPEMTTNIQELSKLTKEMKGGKREEIKEEIEIVEEAPEETKEKERKIKLDELAKKK